MLHTKLIHPPVTSDHISRPNVMKEFDKGRILPLIAVTAPAGYGKSIAVSEWINRSARQHCWLTLDENLNQISIFYEYFIAAIEVTHPDSLKMSKRLIQNATVLTTSALTNQLIAELQAIGRPFTIVLDDFHSIKNLEIHELVSQLINANLINWHFIIISRNELPNSFQSLAFYNKIHRIGAKVLSLSKEETHKLIYKCWDEEIDSLILDDLYKWTEGWILGTRLLLAAETASSLKKKKYRADTLGKTINQLAQLLIEKMNDHEQQLIKLVSFSDRFNEELIAHLISEIEIEGIDAHAFLQKLLNTNLFIIPLDYHNTWFRFHHLFRDLIQSSYLRQPNSNRESILSTISKWYSGTGLIDEGIDYAVRAKDYKHAMKIIIDNKDDVLDNDLWWVVGNWLDRLPEYIQRSNPTLIMARLWVQEFTWDLKDSKALLKILADFPESDWSKRDKAEYKFHQSHNALFHSGDPVHAILLAEQSKSLLQDYGMLGGRRELVLAVSRHMIGKTDEALQKLSAFEETSFKTKPIYLRAYVAKMLVLMISGDYQTAKSYSEHFVFLTKDCPFPTVEAYSIYFQANVNYQLWSDEYTLGYLENALQYQGQLNFRGLIDAYAGYVIALALKGDIDAAWVSWKLMVSKQKDIKRNLFHAEVISTEIRLRCLLNDAKYCLDWATKSLDTEFTLHDPFVVMEVPYITLIRVFVNFGDHSQIQIGLSLIDKLLDKLAALNNHYHHLDVLLLKALAYWRIDNHQGAKEFLNQALEVYNTQRIIRPFLEIGTIQPRLFDLVEIEDLPISLKVLATRLAQQAPSGSEGKKQKIQERLSRREFEVIRLVEKGLRNKEIAERLNLSVLTVKSHLQNIYRKLEVGNRAAMLHKLKNELQGL